MTADLCIGLHGSFMGGRVLLPATPLGGSVSSGGFVTVDGFQKDFAAWAKNHPEGTSNIGWVGFGWMPA